MDRSGKVNLYSPLHLQTKIGENMINEMIALCVSRWGDPSGWDEVRLRWLEEDEQRKPR